MKEIPKDIMETLQKILEESEKCSKCGKQNDEDSFLCKECEHWLCSDCESKNEFVCTVCHNKMERKKPSC